MKFGLWMNGEVCRGVEALDAEDAAEAAAMEDYRASLCEHQRDTDYDVTVMAPDGAITRYSVRLEWHPAFVADIHDDAIDPKAVAALRADRAKAEGGAS